MIPKLNCAIRQSPSVQDRIFAGTKRRIAESSADDVDLRRWCSPVENQGDIGSCAANAVVGAMELLRIEAGHPHVDLSRLFLYYNSRLMHQAQDRDEGTIIRLAMGTLKSLGTCEEKLWAYDPEQVFVRPSIAAYQEAYANKIGGYELIDATGKERVEQIIDALSGGYPVVFGLDATQSFVDGRSAYPSFYGPSVGSHAMLIVGYKRKTDELIVRNSWGPQWGDSGYCYLKSSVLDDRDAFDFWVPHEAPNFFPNA